MSRVAPESVRHAYPDVLGRKSLAEEELAGALGVSASGLARLVRALELLGVVERKDGALSLAAAGCWLRDVANLARLIGAESLPAWGNLSHSVRTEQPAFDAAFGMSVWEHRRRHPDVNDAFNGMMLMYTPQWIEAVLAAYDFRGAGVVVDVGGNTGTTLAGVLRVDERLRGVLFDQPHVVAGAPSVLEAAGVAGRCEVRAGSFFDVVPSGGDLYIIKNVLLNWDDGRAAAILARCRAAMARDKTPILVEQLVPTPEQKDRNALVRVKMDLHFMVTQGGKLRTLAETRGAALGGGCFDEDDYYPPHKRAYAMRDEQFFVRAVIAITALFIELEQRT